MTQASKKVLVSPGFGAGFATGAGSNGKRLAEDPELIAMVEAGTHSSEDFMARVEEICPDSCLLDTSQLKVEEVTGLYRIAEYDGAEYIETLSEIDWW